MADTASTTESTLRPAGPAASVAADLAARAGAIRWYHTMDLGHGVVTQGYNNPTTLLSRLALPDRLDGRTVLDVGAWDGFFAFEAERRGAARVLATDHFSWGGGGWGTKDGFELAREALQSRVEDLTVDVVDLSPDVVGEPFDIVLFLGVLYHLRDPLAALERIRSVTSGLLVVETEVDLLFLRRPAAAFFPGTELNDDPTNWWAPNVPALLGMLRAVGFGRTEVMWRSRLPRRAAHALRGAVKRQPRSLRRLQRDRVVVHAWV